MPHRPAVLLLLLALAASSSPAADRAPVASPSGRTALTLERITASDPPLVPKGLAGFAWRDGSHATWVKTDGQGAGARSSLVEVDAATGKVSELTGPLFPPAEPSAPAGEKPKALSFGGAQWSPKGDALLLSSGGDLWLFTPATKSLKRLTSSPGEEEATTFSPDGAKVSFVRGNDLHVVELATGREARLTTTGTDTVLNGKLDWVYQEELAGRRAGRAYSWAPDSTAIAYLRLDQVRVPTYPIVDFLPTNGKVLPQRYPKAGDPNSVPSVHVVGLNGKETAAVTFSPDDLYVAPELAWTADSRQLCYLVLDRPQTRLEVRLVPRAGGTSRTLLVETDPAWINSIEPPRFLEDGSFVFASERTGFIHVYRYARDGRLLNAVTKGEWAVDRTWEIDEGKATVLFVGTEKDPRERHVYSVGLDGTGFARVTSGRGSHSFDLAPGGKYWLHVFSDLETPPKSDLVAADGRTVARLFDAEGETGEYRLATSELGTLKAADGTVLFTKLVRPASFDPTRKYPVIVYVYGGPHAQVVQDRWGATSLFDHLCAEKGFLVFSLDSRGSWGRGHAFESAVLKRLGEVESKDQLEGVSWLRKQAFVDPARIGVWGWSYGGYLTLYLATHAPEAFRAAVAGAPVADWKLYDSIYTERYMKTPKENPEGYRASSCVESAGKLGPKLQIQHGTSDDNVHMQNTMTFVDALVRARKDFEVVPLPSQKHGPRDPAYRLYSNQRILEFFEKNL